jgi:hypothetical protein
MESATGCGSEWNAVMKIDEARRARRRGEAAIIVGPTSPKAASMTSDEALQALVSREMPFGKYEGRLLADLPGHYLGWFARVGFPPGELGRLLALMYELDHNALRHLLDPLRGKKP